MWVAIFHFLHIFLNKASPFSMKTMLRNHAESERYRCAAVIDVLGFLHCVVCDFSVCLGRKRPLFWEMHFQDIAICENGVPFLLRLNMWLQIICVERQKKKKKKPHLQQWQNSKALQKTGPFYTWYLSLINYIMHNPSFIFLAKPFEAFL